MKRFYKFLMPLVAIVAMALPVTVVAQTDCAYGTITVANATTQTTTTSYFPGYSFYNYSVSEELVPVEALEGLGAEVFSMQFKPASTTAGTYFTNCEVYLANSTLTNLSGGWVQDSSLHLVFTGDLNYTTTDWQTITFDSTFYYTGGSLIVLVRRNHGSYTSGSSFAAYDAGAIMGRYLYQDSGPYTIGSLSGGYTTSTVALYKFTGCYEPVSCAHINGLTVVDLDTTGATISWVDTLNSGASYIIYDNTDSVWASGVTDTFYTFTGLNPNTVYHFFVRVDCGGDSSSASGCSFRTPCTYLDSLPYTTSFEGLPTGSSSTFEFGDPCWTLTTDATQYPYVYLSSSSSYCHTGTRGIYWYRSSSTGSYGTYQCLALPGVTTGGDYEISDLQLKFWAKNESSSYNAIFHVGVMTNPSDFNTFVEVGTVNTNNSTEWTEYVVGLNSYTGTGKFVAIASIYNGSYWYAYFDDVTLEVAPNCPPVTHINIEGTTTSGAYVTWQYQSGLAGVPTQYEIEYIDLDDTTASPVTATATDRYLFITGLNPSTHYQIKVRVDCGGDDYGAWDSTVFATVGFGCAEIDSTTADTVMFSNSTTGQSGCLAYSSWGNTAYQAIYTAEELTAAGLSAGPITGIDLGFTSSSSYAKELTIFMGNTTTTYIGNATMENPQTQVYGPTAHPTGTSGWQHYDFTEPFVWDGSSSILLTTFMNQPTGVSQSSSSGLTGYYVSASNKARFRYRDSQQWTTSNLTEGNSGSTYSYRAAIHFYNLGCSQQATCSTPVAGIMDIDSVSATVAWVPGASETSWNTYYRIYGDTVWSSAGTGVSTMSYTFTNLNPGTDYEFRIVNDCTEGEFGTVVRGTTMCAPFNLPLTEDFEVVDYGVFEPSCWVNGSTHLGTSYPNPYVISLTGDPNKLILFYGGGYLIFPQVAAPLNQLQIRFKFVQGGDNVHFLMGLMRSQDLPIDSMIVLDTLIRSDIDTSTSTVFVTYPFSGINPEYNNYHIAFWDAFNENYSFLDDIVVEYIPVCAPVSGLSATATSNSATINWTEGSSTALGYMVEYGPRNFTPGTGTTVTAASAPVTLSGLAHSSNYDAYVYTICSATDTSIASAVVQFATDCDVYTAMPYSTTFENIVPPGTSSSTVIVPNCWATEVVSSGTAPRIYYTTTTSMAPTQAYCLYFYDLGVTALPQMSMPLNTLMVSFHAYNANPGVNGFIVGAVDSIGPGFSASFEPIDTVVFEYGNGGEYEVTSFLNGYTGNANRIAFKNFNTDATLNYATLYLDNLVVNNIPSCIAPQRVHVTALTNVSADLAWTTSTAPSYSIEYGPHGFTPGTGSTATSTTNAVSLTGLTPYTEYDVRLVSLCSATDQSDTTVFTFTTLRAAPVTTYPYVCDFSDSAAANAWEPVNGTQNSKWYLGSVAHYGTLDSMALYVSSDNGASNTYNGSSLSHTYVYRTFAMNPGSYNIAFKWQSNGEGSTTSSSPYAYDYVRAYLVPAGSAITAGVAPDGGTSSYNNAYAAPQAGWIPLGGNAPLVGATTWQSFSEDVVITAGGSYSLVFYWGNDGSVYNDPAGAIDNVEIYLNTCPAPSNIYAAAAGINSISLDWDDIDTGYVAWNVEYGPAGFTQGAGTMIEVTSHPVAITGLDTLTAYDFYVQPICSGSDTGRWSRPATISTAVCDGASIATTYSNSTSAATTTNYGPIGYSCYNYSYTQIILDSAQMANIGGEITAFSFLPVASAASYGSYYTNMDVYMANIPESAFTDFIVPDSTNHVFQPVILNGNFNFTEDEWQTIMFDTTFTWDGHSNVLFAVNRRHGTYSCSAAFSAHSGSGNKMVYAYDDNTQYNINSPFESGSVTSTVGDLQLISCNSCPAPVVASIVNDYSSATVTINGSGMDYELTYGTDIASLGNAMTSTTGVFNITGLTPATQYFISVTQTCDSGVVSSATLVNFTTDSLPCTEPTDLAVVNTTFSSAELSWTSNGNATSWIISITGAGATRYDTVNTNPYTITNLYADQQYSVMVMAVCGNGAAESGWSDAITFTTDICTPVSNVTVDNITASSATVNWQAVAGSMGYKLFYGFPGFYDTEAQTAEVGANSTNYTITGLAAETAYEVYVLNRCTETLYSNVTANDRVGFSTIAGNGIYDVENGTLTLYPNPASEVVTLTVTGFDGEVNVEIVDMNGKRVSSLRTQNSELQIDLGQIATGAYFVRVTGEHQTAVRKLIVK